ncbi:MAG: hypothetical protein K2J60_17290 [Acetatifactor sp.]|nr:hypothetical protein [Acetatifactor sp.]
MFDFITNKIDFSDEEEYEFIHNQISSTLQVVLNNEKYTLEQMEKLLFTVQSWIQPFILHILSFASLNSFFELKNAYDQVKKSWKEAVERPYFQLEMYCEKCNQIGCIIDSHDDPEYLDSIHFSQEEAELLSEDYFSELKGKDFLSRAIACYSYSIFEAYYNFLNYFRSEKDRNRAIKNCLSQIDNILFNILWWLDCDLGNYTENSYFVKAVNELLAFSVEGEDVRRERRV